MIELEVLPGEQAQRDHSRLAHGRLRIPERLDKLFGNKVFRLVSLMAIAFGATGDIEYALASTVIFLSVMYLLKTPEERRRTGFI